MLLDRRRAIVQGLELGGLPEARERMFARLSHCYFVRLGRGSLDPPL